MAFQKIEERIVVSRQINDGSILSTSDKHWWYGRITGYIVLVRSLKTFTVSESTKISPPKTASLKGLLRSPLARTLLSFFVILPLIEATFIGLLVYDINDTERIAEREFSNVKVCQEFAAVVASIRASNKAVTKYVEFVANSQTKSAFYSCENEFLKEAAEAFRDFDALNITSFTAKEGQLKRVVNDLDRYAVAAMEAPDNLRLDRYHSYQNVLHGYYADFDEVMEAARADASKAKSKEPAFGIEPIYLLYIAGAVNVLMMVAFAVFVEKAITGPISRLASDCQKVKSGELIDRPAKIKNEIDALRESFFDMSCRIAENKKRRSSYLELLQAVQTTALQKVNGWLETVLDFNSCSTQARRRLEKSRGGIGTLIEILQSMTNALSSDTSNNLNPQFRGCSSKQLCMDTGVAVESILEQRKLKLRIDADERALLADPLLLGRVLLNLVSNAAKYSPNAGEIELSARADEQTIRFSVKDHGPGISDKDRDKLFQRFSQLKAADGVKRSGTGLGLVICKEIVEAHGGSIGCDSEVGKGSSFWFSLPLKAKVPATEPNPNAAKAEISSKIVGSLKMQFASILAVFAVIQIALFAYLQGSFARAAQSSQHFTEERKISTESQSLYSFLLLVARAKEQQDVAKLKRGGDEALVRAVELSARMADGSKVKDELTTIQTRLRYLIRLFNYVQGHPDKMNSVVGLKILQRAQRTFDDIEDRLYTVFDLERASFKQSYEGSKTAQEQIVALLVMASLADLAIIIAAAIVALRIINRIGVLQSKSEEFGAGNRISPSLLGYDELALLDKRLCEASDAIQEAENQKQELMAVINHDLRTPLGSILGNLQIVSQGVYGEIQKAPAEVLGRSESELQQLLTQVNDLLLLEKIDSGTYELAKDKLRFNEIIEESMKSVRDEARSKGIGLAIDQGLDLEGAVISGDKQLLVRLCSIILANAVSASESQSHIKMTFRKSGVAIVAEIEDAGPGIAPELRGQIFDRFRFINGKPVTGLGLPLAYRVCRMHGGTILIDSEGHTGTAVEIKLPLVG